MNKYAILFVVGALLAVSLRAQQTSPYLKRSTVGAAGASYTFGLAGQSYYLSQSVGQASVIGSYTNGQYGLRQGFQQPLEQGAVHTGAGGLVLAARVFPNPFVEEIQVEIADKIAQDVLVKLLNMAGETVYAQRFAAAQWLRVPTGAVPVGMYLLQVSSGEHVLVSSLVKTEKL